MLEQQMMFSLLKLLPALQQTGWSGEQQFGLLQHQKSHLEIWGEQKETLSLSLSLSLSFFLSLSFSFSFLFYFSEPSGGGPAPDTNRREPTVLSSTSQLAVYYMMRSLSLSLSLCSPPPVQLNFLKITHSSTWYGFRASLLPIVMITYGM